MLSLVWEGDLNGNSPSGILSVDDQIAVTANFQIPDTLNAARITTGLIMSTGT